MQQIIWSIRTNRPCLSDYVLFGNLRVQLLSKKSSFSSIFLSYQHVNWFNLFSIFRKSRYRLIYSVIFIKFLHLNVFVFYIPYFIFISFAKLLRLFIFARVSYLSKFVQSRRDEFPTTWLVIRKWVSVPASKQNRAIP